MQRPFSIEIDWHTIEKVVWATLAFIVTAAFTIARPWAAKMLLKLMREDRAAYREFGREMWKETFDQIDKASKEASEALRMAQNAKEDIERLESASEEQGLALAELKDLPVVMEKVTKALEIVSDSINEGKVLMARFDERLKSRSSSSTPVAR